MSKHISQREARRLRQRVNELEATLQRFYHQWGAEFVGGTHLHTIPRSDVPDLLFGAVHAARKLRHAVAVNAHSDGLKFYGLPLDVEQ